VERIDLSYLHTGRATDAPFADQVAPLAELREKGLIKNIGLSNVTVEQLREAREITDIAAVTAHCNVAARYEQPLLDAAVGGGSVFVPWQPVSLTTPGDSTDTNGPRRSPGAVPDRRGARGHYSPGHPGLAADALAFGAAGPGDHDHRAPAGEPGRPAPGPDAGRDQHD
jgi:aryl-alcohol dehydrogenase-like predicted oxidoreductase